MGLFFATFTIMFPVGNLLEDRRLGVGPGDPVDDLRSAMAGATSLSFVT